MNKNMEKRCEWHPKKGKSEEATTYSSYKTFPDCVTLQPETSAFLITEKIQPF